MSISNWHTNSYTDVTRKCRSLFNTKVFKIRIMYFLMKINTKVTNELTTVKKKIKKPVDNFNMRHIM